MADSISIRMVYNIPKKRKKNSSKKGKRKQTKSSKQEQWMCKDCRNTFLDPVVYKSISKDKRCPFCGSERIAKDKETAIDIYK